MIRAGADAALRAVLGSLLYFPSRQVLQTPADAGLAHRELTIKTDDGEHLHAWWIAARSQSLGHILFCHGNAGNIGDRVIQARLLSAAGFDLLLFDYRGYGLSSGRPDEPGTYADACAAREALLAQSEVDPARVLYLGESLGGAVALQLALQSRPRGLILQSTFTSVRDAARRHYPMIPAAIVPDAYPSLRRIRELRAPVLLIHGDQDQIVPVAHARELLDAAPEPKRLHIFRGLGHNDLVAVAGTEYAATIASWATQLATTRPVTA